MERKKQYKKKWISAKRQLNRLAQEHIVSETVENERNDAEAIEDAVCVNLEATISSTTPIHGDWSYCEDNMAERESLSPEWNCSKLSSESVEYDSVDEHLNDTELRYKLGEWVTENHVKNNAVDQLLKILQEAGHHVPATARSLLKTVVHVSVVEKSGMQYCYLGIIESLTQFVSRLSENKKGNLDRLEIALNVDGLPLFKSSSYSLWPILCSVVNVLPVHVFPVALAGGSNKPTNLDFLIDTVRDLNTLLIRGLTVGVNNYTVILKAVVCDAPARAMVKSIKQYSGYAGCDKCEENGSWLGRMTFQKIGQLRTNERFRRKEQPQHHNGTSPFCELSIDMIKTFPIDYMHQCCLGVQKKLLLAWMRGKKETKLSSGQICEISSSLLNLRKNIPKIFARKPRSLLEIDRWKATELRLFLLYIGKLVLKKVLKRELYNHFLIFSVAISILVSPALVSKNSVYAHELLVCFVDQCRQLYGPEFLTYNLHSMTHLASEAVEHGSLDNCSAFRFESYLFEMKKMVRSGRSPVTQIVKRLSELKPQKVCELRVAPVKFEAPNNAYITEMLECCEVLNMVSSSCSPGSELLANKHRYLLCRVHKIHSSFFDHPCDSRIIGTYTVHNRDSSLQVLSESKLKKQAIRVDVGHGRSCFMTILHDI